MFPKLVFSVWLSLGLGLLVAVLILDKMNPGKKKFTPKNLVISSILFFFSGTCLSVHSITWKSQAVYFLGPAVGAFIFAGIGFLLFLCEREKQKAL